MPRHDRESDRPSRRPFTEYFTKVPPHAVEAEMALLGSMMLDPRCIDVVTSYVAGGFDFYKPAHSVLYDLIVELYERNSGKLDLILLGQTLRDRGQLEAVGGEDYLVEIGTSVPSASNADHYARQVRDKATLRRMIVTCSETIERCFEAADTVESLVDELESSVMQIRGASSSKELDATTLVDRMEATIERIERRELRTGILTGFHDLDEVTSGLFPGEITIVAARPSMGKTAFALSLLLSMMGKGARAGFFSLEMSRDQIVDRVLAIESGVSSTRIRRAQLSTEQLDRVVQACRQHKKSPLIVADLPSMSLTQIRSMARRMVTEQRVNVIAIDYLQLIRPPRKVDSRQVEVADISAGLKGLARELQIPVIVLAQLNRDVDRREGHRPRMSDLRESGAIEQDADVLTLLHREAYFKQHDQEWMNAYPEKIPLAELIVAKQRNGPTGTVNLHWNGETMRFSSWSGQEGMGF